MDAFVFAAVLFAAACHAGWNATIKRGLDPLASTVAISLGAALVSLLALPVVGLPAREAWPWVLASIAIHLVYFAALIESYRTGDMGQVYPIARGPRRRAQIAMGAAWRETSVLSGVWMALIVLRERLRTGRMAAAFLIVCGLVLVRLY